MNRAQIVALGVSILCAGLSWGCGRGARDAGQEQPTPTSQQAAPADELREEKIGGVGNLHVYKSYYLAAQPGEGDFVLLKERGVERVINLRTPGEMKFDEAKVAADLGMEYHHVPVASADSLTDDAFARLRGLLEDDGRGAILLHCASANRVGAVWLVKRVLDDGVPYDKALREARTVGLRSPALQDRAAEYIESQGTPE